MPTKKMNRCASEAVQRSSSARQPSLQTYAAGFPANSMAMPVHVQPATQSVSAVSSSLTSAQLPVNCLTCSTSCVGACGAAPCQAAPGRSNNLQQCQTPLSQHMLQGYRQQLAYAPKSAMQSASQSAGAVTSTTACQLPDMQTMVQQHPARAHLDSLVEDDSCVGNVAVHLVKLGKRNPEGVGLADGFIMVHSFHCLCVGQNLHQARGCKANSKSCKCSTEQHQNDNPATSMPMALHMAYDRCPQLL